MHDKVLAGINAISTVFKVAAVGNTKRSVAIYYDDSAALLERITEHFREAEVLGGGVKYTQFVVVVAPGTRPCETVGDEIFCEQVGMRAGPGGFLFKVVFGMSKLRSGYIADRKELDKFEAEIEERMRKEAVS